MVLPMINSVDVQDVLCYTRAWGGAFLLELWGFTKMLYQLDYQFEHPSGPGTIMTVVGGIHSIYEMYSFMTGSHDFNPNLPKIRAACIRSTEIGSPQDPLLYKHGNFDRSVGRALTRSTQE